MSGNVSEWCSDFYGSYSSNDKTDPRGSYKGPFRIRRGGDWSTHASFSRVASRYFYHPNNKSNILGFRLTLPLEGYNRLLTNRVSANVLERTDF